MVDASVVRSAAFSTVHVTRKSGAPTGTAPQSLQATESSMAATGAAEPSSLTEKPSARERREAEEAVGDEDDGDTAEAADPGGSVATEKIDDVDERVSALFDFVGDADTLSFEKVSE